MISVDTKALVRILIDDPKFSQEAKQARHLAQTAKRVYVPQSVQLECAWVLESAYKLNKSDMLRVLRHIWRNQAFVLQDSDAYKHALDMYELADVDFSECLVLSDLPQVEIHDYKEGLLNRKLRD